MSIQVRFTRIDEINVFGQFSGKLGLAGTKVAVDCNDQAVVAESIQSGVEDLAEKAVLFVFVVVGFAVTLADLVDGKVSFGGCQVEADDGFRGRGGGF